MSTGIRKGSAGGMVSAFSDLGCSGAINDACARVGYDLVNANSDADE